ncbi:MAG: copper resistance protein CopA, partial [Rhodospirillales bacterium]|nr:copper resistance protein CopA [Rhodospirillales bacterium]
LLGELALLADRLDPNLVERTQIRRPRYRLQQPVPERFKTVAVDEFRMGVAETYDVIVEPGDAAYAIFAQSEDRTGFASGTLAPREGMSAAVPPMDPRPMRAMKDMGMGNMDMGDMDMSSSPKAQGQMPSTKADGMAGMDMKGMDMARPSKNQNAMPGMKMDGMDLAPTSKNQNAMPGMKMDGMKDMDHGQKGGMDMGSMPGMKMDQGAVAGMPGMSAKGSNASPLNRSVEVDNVAMTPTDRLNEPGIGLDGENRRILTYADLRARIPGDDPRPPSREITLHLTGNMQRFIWGFDGKKFSEAEPIRLKFGERVRFILINDTMMEHPIHLHGLWSELENGQGQYRPYKHTITVKAGEQLSYLVTADEPGMWAFHCHLLYHMEMGMFRTVVVS